MKAKVKVQVTEVALKEEYARKSNGLTDYDHKVQHYDSTLSVLDNAIGVRGTLIIKEKLEIGTIHEIIVDTENAQQVIELEGLAASRLKED